MARTVNLPQLGQTMEEGTIVNCLIELGQKVSKGDVIFEIETDKATLEMECPIDGYVKKILVKEGQTLLVKDPVLILGDKDEVVNDNTITEPELETTPQTDKIIIPTSANVINLPQLGQTMEEGTIVNCLIEEGQDIAKGDVIFEIETDKATLEMECPASGFVKKILVEVGQTVPVNVPVLVLGDKDEEFSSVYLASITTTKPKSVTETITSDLKQAEILLPTELPIPTVAQTTAKKQFASPRAKMVAKELGIDIELVKPTPGKPRITEKDVRKLAPAGLVDETESKDRFMDSMPTPTHKLGESVPMSRMQKVVGDRMLQSKLNIPCFYLNSVVDVTDIFKLRAQLNRSGDVKISFNDFIIKAIGVAVKQFPLMAGQLDGNNIKIAENIHVGLAIAVGDDLIAPISKNSDIKNLIEIAEYNQDMISRSKTGKIGPDDLNGGCITLSNLGGFGIDSFIPIVVPGQCSILGVGKISDSLVPENGNIMVRKLMKMTLSVDHKVANGAYAAQFLDYIRKLLEDKATFV